MIGFRFSSVMYSSGSVQAAFRQNPEAFESEFCGHMTLMHEDEDGTSDDGFRDASQLSIPPFPQLGMLTQLRNGTLNESNPRAVTRPTTSMISWTWLICA